MRRVVRAGILAVLTLLCAATLRAEDRIWAALVLGTNEQPPKAVPKELAAYAAGLKAVFGANTFYVLGVRAQKIREGTEEWIVPSREVFLKMRVLDREPAAYTIQLELYVKKRLVVTTEVRLARGAPLYIRGPAWGRGRLIFILEVK